MVIVTNLSTAKKKLSSAVFRTKSDLCCKDYSDPGT